MATADGMAERIPIVRVFLAPRSCMMLGTQKGIVTVEDAPQK
jgi:hypothetical protein